MAIGQILWPGFHLSEVNTLRAATSFYSFTVFGNIFEFGKPGERMDEPGSNVHSALNKAGLCVCILETQHIVQGGDWARGALPGSEALWAPWSLADTGARGRRSNQESQLRSGQDPGSAVSFCHRAPGDFHFQAKLQMSEGMQAFTSGARAHQEFSDGETISNDGSQSANGGHWGLSQTFHKSSS